MDIFLLILIGVLSRMIPHPANMTAVGGIALFSGAKLQSWKALMVIFFTMFISDAILGFHTAMWATYGSMILAVLLGRVLQRSHAVRHLIAISFISSVVFFLITNFAVWLQGLLYPKTIAGLMDCYIMAIPFFRNSIIGDQLFSVVFFYGYQYVMNFSKKRIEYV